MANIFVQFIDEAGLKLNPLSLSADANSTQLNAIVNQLLENEEEVPYSFFVNDVSIENSLQNDIFDRNIVTKEGLIEISYKKKAVFRVQAVSRCSSSLAGHEDAILCTAFCPQGKRLASGSGDKSVRFWDLNTNTPLSVGHGHDGWVLCISWCPNGKILASGDMEGTLCLWDGKSGALLSKIKAHKKWITSLCWEPLHLNGTPRLITSSKDNTAKIWDTTRSSCVHTLSQHTDAITCVKWGGDGTIYTASRDRTIKLWNADGSLKTTLKGHAHWINSLALNSDYVLRTGSFEPGSPFNSQDSTSIGLAKERYGKFIEKCGKELLISCSDDFTMFLWDLSTTSSNKEIKPIGRLNGHQSIVNHVAFSPDGKYIASAGFDKSVKLWNGVDGKFLHSFRGHVGRVYQLCWSADSRMILSSSQDSTAKIWDVNGRKLKEDLPGHLDEVYSVDWSPSGDMAVSGGKDKLLKIWKS